MNSNVNSIDSKLLNIQSFLFNSEFQSNSKSKNILIAHGLLGSSKNWFTLARSLSQYHNVFLMDLCNHGKSHWLENMDYIHMAKHLYQYLFQNQLLNENLVLMGHSMGGKLMMAFKLIYTKFSIPFIVIDIAPIEYPNEHHIKDIEALLSLDVDTLNNRSEANDYLKTFIPDDQHRNFLLHNLILKKEAYKTSYEFQCNLSGIKNSLEFISSFPQFLLEAHIKDNGKHLFICGKRSNYVFEYGRLMILEHFPMAEITYIENAGHNVHVDASAELIQVILKFLNP